MHSVDGVEGAAADDDRQPPAALVLLAVHHFESLPHLGRHVLVVRHGVVPQRRRAEKPQLPRGRSSRRVRVCAEQFQLGEELLERLFRVAAEVDGLERSSHLRGLPAARQAGIHLLQHVAREVQLALYSRQDLRHGGASSGRRNAPRKRRRVRSDGQQPHTGPRPPALVASA